MRKEIEVIKNTILNRFELTDVMKVKKIKNLTFDVTSLCNSRCTTCSIWQNKGNEDEMTVGEIQGIFKDPIFSDLENLILTGGEPFLRNDIWELIYVIYRNLPNVCFTYSTNGILADKVLNVVKKSIESKIKFTVGISVDGIGEIHDKRRGVKGNFEIISYLIKELNSLKKVYGKDSFNFGVGHCFDEKGIETIGEVAKFASENNAWFITQMVEGFDFYKPLKMRKVETENQVTVMQSKKLGVSIHEWFGENGKTALKEKLLGELDKLEPSIQNELLKEAIKGKQIIYDCYALRTFFLLRYNGNVSPCVRYADIIFGNLKEKNMSEIATEKKYKDGINFVRQCTGCFNSWCTGWSMKENALSFAKYILKSRIKKLGGF